MESVTVFTKIEERRANLQLVGIALIFLNLELDVSNMSILFGSLSLQIQQYSA